jgi:hypothetical protein
MSPQTKIVVCVPGLTNLLSPHSIKISLLTLQQLPNSLSLHTTQIYGWLLVGSAYQWQYSCTIFPRN